MPFSAEVMNSFHVALADGPTEVHKIVVAREVLKGYRPSQSQFPSYIRYEREAQARAATAPGVSVG
jgi:acyl-CoA dehydrogenase